MYKISIFIIITLISAISFAQTNVFLDKVYDNDIKTVTLKPESNILAYPIISLNSNENLLLSFDDLGMQSNDFQYTIIHCDADWTESDLIYDDYCSGFEENSFYEYKHSFNTLVDYINYSLTIPNNDVDFKLSGNYVIIVYRDYDTEDTVFTKRFVVTENRAIIDGEVIKPQVSAFLLNYQQVNFNVTSDLFDNAISTDRITVNVLQNNSPFNSVYNAKPNFINGKSFVFNDPMRLVFKAGNEFRIFDCQNIRFQTEKVADIKLEDYYNFYLVPEPEEKSFNYIKDINGRFFINNQIGTDPEVDADYVYVHFYFTRDYSFNDDVYIIGELTNWQLLPDFKMEYNSKYKTYQKTLLLKQGYYNYKYFLDNPQNIHTIDGDFYETENDYVIYVYYRDIRMNCDRLIAVNVLSNK